MASPQGSCARLPGRVLLLRAGMVLVVVSAVALSGCTSSPGGLLSFNEATLEEPSFDLSPETGDKDTLFHVDSRGLGKKHNVTWDWGDGTFSYGAEAEHRYGFTNGQMTVTLIATSAEDGRQGIATRQLTLGDGLNKMPTVSARAQRTWIEVGQRTNLTATGSDSDRDPLTYFWSYQAAGAAAETTLDSNANRVPVEFAEPGVYDVKVRARDPKGGEAVANVTLTVSRDIPNTRFEQAFNGTVIAGTVGAGASEKAWLASQAGAPVPDTNVDSVRHRYTLLYPAYTLIFLTWTDTSGQGAIDLDLELRHAGNGTVIFTSATRAPAPAFEFNLTQQEPGDYDVVVRGVVAANVAYTALVQATLQITPDLVLAAEGN